MRLYFSNLNPLSTLSTFTRNIEEGANLLRTGNCEPFSLSGDVFPCICNYYPQYSYSQLFPTVVVFTIILHSIRISEEYIPRKRNALSAVLSKFQPNPENVFIFWSLVSGLIIFFSYFYTFKFLINSVNIHQELNFFPPIFVGYSS